MNKRYRFFIFLLIISFYPATFAGDYVPLNITDGMWEVELNFEKLLTPQQKVKMKQALASLEQMKKKNPAMAAQIAQATASLGLKGTSVTKKNCLNRKDMKNEMDKMLNQESSSDRKCKGEILKSTPKLIEGKSTCGDKVYHYKITVQNKKKMKTLITTHDGKTIEGNFKWLAKKCTDESLGK